MKIEIDLTPSEVEWLKTFAENLARESDITPSVALAIRALIDHRKENCIAIREMNWSDRQNTLEEVYDKCDELHEHFDATVLLQGIREISDLTWEFISDPTRVWADEENMSYSERGSAPQTKIESKVHEEEVRLTLRCPKWIIDSIDEERKSRAGRPSRNLYIIDILQKYVITI